MATMDDDSSLHSSQSSLSGLPSDDEIEMHTRAKARRLAEDDDEDDEVSDEEQEAAANGSASEEDDEAMGAEDEEADELDDDDDSEEAEELEEGDGDDYETEEVVGTKQQIAAAAKTRKPPVRVASNTSRKRKAIAELSRSASEDSSPALRVPSSSSATKGGTTRKITLRISPSKNLSKGKKAAAPATEKKRQPRQSKTTTKQQQIVDDEEEEEDEIEDDEEEDAQNEEVDGDADSWDSEDFENDQSFARLPKTARQLAKERAILGTESGSELQELPIEESKKTKLTESEIALRKSEMSRRRRNQTEKKLEDDKIETINRLLKKQVTRRSNREKAGAADDSEADMEEDEATGIVEKKVVDPKQVRLELKQAPRPFFRYIQTTSGSTLNLPIEEDSEAQPYQNRWETVFTKRAAV